MSRSKATGPCHGGDGAGRLLGRPDRTGLSLAESVSYRFPPDLGPKHPLTIPGELFEFGGDPEIAGRRGARILPQHGADAATCMRAAVTAPCESRWWLTVEQPAASLSAGDHVVSVLFDVRTTMSSAPYKRAPSQASRFFRQQLNTVIDCDACRSASSSAGFFARVLLRDNYGCAGERLEGKQEN